MKYIGSHLEYACLHWVRHLTALTPHARAHVLQENGRIHNFLRSKLLFLLEVMSLEGWVDEFIRHVKVLKSLHQVSPPTPFDMSWDVVSRANVKEPTSNQLSAFIHDTWRFIQRHRKVIAEAPLQIYISALIFSPTESITRRTFADLIPKWITRAPEIEKHWDRRIYSIEWASNSYKPPVTAAKISPDGTVFVVWTSQDLLVRDTTTGEVKFEIKNRCWSDFIFDGTYLRCNNTGRWPVYNDRYGEAKNKGVWRVHLSGPAQGTVERDDNPWPSSQRKSSQVAETSVCEQLSDYENVKLPSGSRLIKTQISEKEAVAVFEVGQQRFYNKSVAVWSSKGDVLWKRTFKLRRRSSFDSCPDITISGDAILIQHGAKAISVWSTSRGTLLWRCSFPKRIRAWAASNNSNPRLAVLSATKIGVFSIDSQTTLLFVIDCEYTSTTSLHFSTSDMLLAHTGGSIMAIDTGIASSTAASPEPTPSRDAQPEGVGGYQESQELSVQLDHRVAPRYVGLQSGLGLFTVTESGTASGVSLYSVQLWDSAMIRTVFQCSQVLAMSTSVHLRAIVLVTLSAVLELDVDTLTTRTLLSPTPRGCILHGLTPDASVAVWRKTNKLHAIGMDTRSELYTVQPHFRPTATKFFVERSITHVEDIYDGSTYSVVDIATGKVVWTVKRCRCITESTKRKTLLAIKDYSLLVFDIETTTVVHRLDVSPLLDAYSISVSWSDVIILRVAYTRKASPFPRPGTVIMDKDTYRTRYDYLEDHYALRMTSVSIEDEAMEDDSMDALTKEYNTNRRVSSHIIDNTGRLPSKKIRSNLTSEPLDKTDQLCLYQDRGWLRQCQRMLIWTGKEYGFHGHGLFEPNHRLCVSGGRALYVLEFGRLVLLEVDLESTPFARGWDVADGDNRESIPIGGFMAGVFRHGGQIWRDYSRFWTPDVNDNAEVDDADRVVNYGPFDNQGLFTEATESNEEESDSPRKASMDEKEQPAASYERYGDFECVDDDDGDGDASENVDDGDTLFQILHGRSVYDYGDFVGAECYFDSELSSDQGWTTFEP